MNTTAAQQMDPQHLAIVLWAVLGVGSVVLGLLGWSLRQNLAAVRTKFEAVEQQFSSADRKLDAIASDLRTLGAAVGQHDKDLARLGERVDFVVRRVDGLEERERREHFIRGDAG